MDTAFRRAYAEVMSLLQRCNKLVTATASRPYPASLIDSSTTKAAPLLREMKVRSSALQVVLPNFCTNRAGSATARRCSTTSRCCPRSGCASWTRSARLRPERCCWTALHCESEAPLMRGLFHSRLALVSSLLGLLRYKAKRGEHFAISEKEKSYICDVLNLLQCVQVCCVACVCVAHPG